MNFQTQYQPELESIQDIPSFLNPFTENPHCLNILRECEEVSVFAKSAEFFENYELACDKIGMIQEDYEEPLPYEPRNVPFTTNFLSEESSNDGDHHAIPFLPSCNQINSNTIGKDSTVGQAVNQIDENEENVDDSTSSKIEEIKEDPQKKREKSYMDSKTFDIYKYISWKLKTFTRSLHKSHKKTQGRPRKIITDEEKQIAIDEWAEQLISKASSFDSRSDAHFTTVVRQFKKIPGLILKLFGCKGDYKSDDLKITLDSYLDCFFKGFVKYFAVSIPEYLEAGSEEEYELINLFLDFCILKYPEDRVRLLLGMFDCDDSLKISSFSLKANTIYLKRSTSIKNVRCLFNANSAYQLICAEYHKLIPNINDDIKESIQKVVSKFSN